MQPDSHINIDQSDHIINACSNYFKDRTTLKWDISFLTDPEVEDDYATSFTHSPEELNKLECQNGASFRSLYDQIQT